MWLDKDDLRTFEAEDLLGGIEDDFETKAQAILNPPWKQIANDFDAQAKALLGATQVGDTQTADWGRPNPMQTPVDQLNPRTILTEEAPAKPAWQQIFDDFQTKAGEILGGVGDELSRRLPEEEKAKAPWERTAVGDVAGAIGQTVGDIAGETYKTSLGGRLLGSVGIGPVETDEEALARLRSGDILAGDEEQARLLARVKNRGREPTETELSQQAKVMETSSALALAGTGGIGKLGKAAKAPKPTETITPFGRVEEGAAAAQPFEEAAAVPRPSISRAETAAKAEAFEITPQMIDDIARQPEGEKAVVLTRLRQEASGYWERRARIQKGMDEETIALQAGQDELASLNIRQGMLRTAERMADATTEAAKREASETGRALNSMRIAVNGRLADQVVLHYKEVQKTGADLVKEVSGAARSGKALGKNGQQKIDDLSDYLKKEAEGTAVPKVTVEEAPQTATEATAKGQRTARPATPKDATDAMEKAVREVPELKQLGRELAELNRTAGQARGPEGAGTTAAQALDTRREQILSRMDEILEEQVIKQLEKEKKLPATPEEARTQMLDLLASPIIAQRRRAIKERLLGWDKAKVTGSLENKLSAQMAKALARDEQRQQKMVAKLSMQVEKEINRIYEAVQTQAAGMEERAIKGTARETLGLLDRFRKAAPGTPEYRQYANDVLMGLSRLGTDAKAEMRRHTLLANRQRVRGLLSQAEKNLSPEEQGARIDEMASQLARFTDEDWADTRAARMFAASVTKEGGFEKVHRWRLSSMLSGVPTMLLNLFGSGVETAKAPIVRTIAGVSERVKPIQKGTINATERMALDELTGIVEGHSVAWQEFMKTIDSGVSGRPRADLNFQVRLNKKNPADVPLLVLQATDDYWYTLNFGAALKAETRLESLKTGKSMTAIKLDLLNHPEVVERAAEQAARRTYTQDMGRLGKAIGVIRDNPVGKTIQPFFSTIANMSQLGAELTPLPKAGGFAQAAKYAKEGDFARAAERRAQGVLGASIMATAGLQAVNGNVTGYGPTDPKKRKDWLDQGNQPYSVRIGNQWVKYSNWGSLAIPLAMAASAVEATREGVEERSVTRALTAGVLAFGNLWLDMAAARGVADVVNAITDPERFGERFAEGIALSYTSPGFFSSLARVFDPEVKSPENYFEALKSRYPGVSKQVRPLLTQLGEPRTRQSGPGALLPFRTSEVKPSPVYGEYERLRGLGFDVAIGKTSDEIRDIRLTGDEQADYQQQVGTVLDAAIGEIITWPEYKGLPPEKQARLLVKLEQRVRNKASKRFLADVLQETPLEDLESRLTQRQEKLVKAGRQP